MMQEVKENFIDPALQAEAAELDAKLSEVKEEKRENVLRREKLEGELKRLQGHVENRKKVIDEFQQQQHDEHKSAGAGLYLEQLQKAKPPPDDLTPKSIENLEGRLRVIRKEISSEDSEQRRLEKGLMANKVRQLAVSITGRVDKISSEVGNLQFEYARLVSDLNEIKSLDEREWSNRLNQAGLADWRFDLVASVVTHMPATLLEWLIIAARSELGGRNPLSNEAVKRAGLGGQSIFAEGRRDTAFRVNGFGG